MDGSNDLLEEMAKITGRKPVKIPTPKIQPTVNPFEVESILDEVQGGVVEQESGGNPRIQNNRTKATGLFQVMPANIPAWSRTYLGREYSIPEFQADPEAQRKVFRGEYGKYLKKALQLSNGDKDKAIRMASAAWYGGEGAMNRYDDPTKFRTDEPSFREYTSSVLGKIRKKPNTPFDTTEADNLLGEMKKITGGNNTVPADFSSADSLLSEMKAITGGQLPATNPQQAITPQIVPLPNGEVDQSVGKLDKYGRPLTSNSEDIPVNQKVRPQENYVKRDLGGLQSGEKYYEFEKTGKSGDLNYLGQVNGKYRFTSPDGDELEWDEKTNQTKTLGTPKKVNLKEGGTLTLDSDNQFNLTENQYRYKDEKGKSYISEGESFQDEDSLDLPPLSKAEQKQQAEVEEKFNKFLTAKGLTKTPESIKAFNDEQEVLANHPIVPNLTKKSLAGQTAPVKELEQKGKFKLGDIELIETDSFDLPDDKVRVKDPDGETYIIDKKKMVIDDESLKSNADTLTFTRVPYQQKATVPKEMARNMAIAEIGKQLKDKYAVDEEVFAKFIQDKKLTDLGTENEAGDGAFYTDRLGAKTTNTYTVTRRDLRDLVLTSRKKNEDYILDLIEKGQTPTEEDYKKANIDSNSLQNSRYDDYQTSLVKGKVAAEDFDKFTQANLSQGQAEVIAKINASAQVGRITRKQANQLIGDYKNDLNNTKLQTFEERQGVSDELNQYRQTAQGYVAGELPEVTDKQIDEEIRFRNLTKLTEAERQKAESIGGNINDPVSAGLVGTSGRTMLSAAGILRPLANLAKDSANLTGLEPFKTFAGAAESWYSALSKQGQTQGLAEETFGKNNDGTLSTVVRIGTGLTGDLSRLYLLSQISPGGSVVGFGLDSAVTTAGGGANPNEVIKQGLKGAGTGLLFEAAPLLSKYVGGKAFSALLSADAKSALKGLSEAEVSAIKEGSMRVAPEIRNAWVASKILGEGTRIGTIYGGTFGTAKAFGATNAEAFDEALRNTLMDLAMSYGGKLSQGVQKLGGKIFKFTKDGETANGYVDKDGNVRKVDGEIPRDAVDYELVYDAKTGEFNKQKVKFDESKVERNITPEGFKAEKQGGVRTETEIKQPNEAYTEFVNKPIIDADTSVNKQAVPQSQKSLETSAEPKALAEKNPLRIEQPDSKAVESLSTDKRAQKIDEILKDGQPQSVESLAKLTKYSESNISNAIDTLYGARRLEILPDNTVRKISSEEISKPNQNLYEKYSQPKINEEISTVPKPAAPLEASKPVSNTVAKSEVPKVEPSIEDITNKTYSAIPQQKAQTEKVEKEVAKVVYDERPNLAEKLNVFTERGTKASIEPRVVDSSDLLTSLDEGYPQKFQPRDRSRQASKAQISEIANKLNPEFLGDSPKASDGRPLVVPVEMPDGSTKYAVISGNGRTAGIKQAYDLGNEGSKAYKDFVKGKGKGDFNQPVYVGILNPDEIQNFSEFAKESNESATALMSASEQAKADADRLDSSILNLFVPSEDGTIHGSANRDFVRAFLDKTTSTSERNRFIDAEGKLNQEGVTRVKNAIFAKAFSNSEMGMATLARMSESTDSNIKNITNALLAKAGELSSFSEATKDKRRYKELDISTDFARAMEKYSELKEGNVSIDEYIQQGTLFGADTSPLQTRVMQVFDHYKRRSKSIKSIIDNYITAAEAIGDPNQVNLFGVNEIPSKESIFEGAVRSYEREDTGENEPSEVSLFDQDKRGENEPKPRQESDDSITTAETEKQELTPTQKAELRRNKEVSEEELKAKGITPLTSVGKFGQTVYRIRQAMTAQDSNFLPDLAKVFLPDVDLSDKNAGNAVLDKIAELSNKNRSSELSPLDWQRLLSNHADKMEDSTIDTILGAINHQQDWHKDYESFINSPETDKILTRIENEIGFENVTSYGKLPKDIRLEIKKLGAKYGKLSEKTISETFGKGLQTALDERVSVREGRAETGSVETNGEEETQITRPETDKRLSELNRPSYSFAKSDSRRETALNNELETVLKTNFRLPELLTKAEIKNLVTGEQYLNPEAYWLMFEAHNTAFEEDSTVWTGSYLTPDHVKAVRNALENIIQSADSQTQRLARKFLRQFDAGIDSTHKDLIQIATGKNAPTGIKSARQEERSHRADYRVGDKHEIGIKVARSLRQGRKSMSNLKRGVYKKVSDRQLAIESIAKTFVDGGNVETGLTEAENDEMAVKYLLELLKNKKTIEEIETNYAKISKKAGRYVENVKRSAGSITKIESDGSTPIPVGSQSDPSPRRTGRTFSDADSAAKPRNLGTGFLDNFGRSEEQSLARREENSIAKREVDKLERPSYSKIEEPKTPLAKKLFNQLYEKRGDEHTPKKEVLVNFRRAGLLTSPKTHLRNIISNVAFQASEEAMRPVALLADLVTSAVTGKRTVQAPSIPGVLKSFRNLVSADKTMEKLNQESAINRAWSILRSGDIKELEKNQLSEMKSGSPLLDKFVNYTFRALGAEDALFKTYALRRSLEEQAKTIAITKARDISWKSPVEKLKYIRAQKLELLANPTNEMLMEGVLFADFSTFTNHNPISDWFRKIKDANATGKAVLETIVPYDKTPTNIVMRTLEYSPVGFGMSAKHLIDLRRGESYTINQLKKSLGDKWEGLDKNREATRAKVDSLLAKLFEQGEQLESDIDILTNKTRTADESREMFNLEDELKAVKKKIGTYSKLRARRKIKDNFRDQDRKEIEDAINDFFPRFQQQQFAKSFGRAGFGTAALALGIYLGMRGLLSGVWDAGDKEEKSEHFDRQEKGILDGSLILGGRRYQIADSPLGKTMVAGASFWERSQQELDKGETKTGKTFNDVFDVSKGIIKQQPLLNSMDDYFGSNKSKEARIGGLLGSFVPAILNDIADISDDEKRETKSLFDYPVNRTPILREDLPKAKYDREPYLQDRTNRLINRFDPTNSRPIYTKEERKQMKIEKLENQLKTEKDGKKREILIRMIEKEK